MKNITVNGNLSCLYPFGVGQWLAAAVSKFNLYFGGSEPPPYDHIEIFQTDKSLSISVNKNLPSLFL